MSVATKYQSYYTKSEPILNYMTNMLNIKATDLILEPCGGDGVFVDKIMENIPFANISIFELNPNAVKILKDKYKRYNNIFIKSTDTLLDECIVKNSISFDKIIGNPPYGARNNMEKKEILNRIYPDLYTKESYTLFLYACIKCLKEHGILSFIIPDTFLSLHRHLAIRQFILQNTKIKELAMFPSSFFPGVNFGYANLCIMTLEKSSNKSDNLKNLFAIRTGFNTVDELEDKKKGIVKIVSQECVYNNIGSAFLFNSSERINELINDAFVIRIGDIASCVTGFYSGNDKAYLRPISQKIKNAKKYQTALIENIFYAELTEEEKNKGIKSEKYLVPIVKGGNKKYIKPNEWFMDWSEKAISEYRCSKKCRFQNSSFYFTKYGIAIPMIRSKRLTAALIDGRLFDQSIVGVFPMKNELTSYLLAFFNSNVCTKLIDAINPSTNNSANYIKKIPFIYPSDDMFNKINDWISKIIDSIKNDNNDTAYYENKIELAFEELYDL